MLVVDMVQSAAPGLTLPGPTQKQGDQVIYGTFKLALRPVLRLDKSQKSARLPFKTARKLDAGYFTLPLPLYPHRLHKEFWLHQSASREGSHHQRRIAL